MTFSQQEQQLDFLSFTQIFVVSRSSVSSGAVLASPPVHSHQQRRAETTILADQSLSVFLCLCSPAGVLGIRLFMPGMVVVVVGGTPDCGDNRTVRLGFIMKLPDQTRPAVRLHTPHCGPSSPHWLAGWRRLSAATLDWGLIIRVFCHLFSPDSLLILQHSWN